MRSMLSVTPAARRAIKKTFQDASAVPNRAQFVEKHTPMRVGFAAYLCEMRSSNPETVAELRRFATFSAFCYVKG